MRKFGLNVRTSAPLALAVLVASSAPSLSQAAPARRIAWPPQAVMKAHEDCAFCIARALADRMIFGTPPLLRLPTAFALLYATTDAEFFHLKSAGADFEPRTRHTS